MACKPKPYLITPPIPAAGNDHRVHGKRGKAWLPGVFWGAPEKPRALFVLPDPWGKHKIVTEANAQTQPQSLGLTSTALGCEPRDGERDKRTDKNVQTVLPLQIPLVALRDIQ